MAVLCNTWLEDQGYFCNRTIGHDGQHDAIPPVTTDEAIAEFFGLTPVYMEDKIDGSDVEAVEWRTLVPMLKAIARQQPPGSVWCSDCKLWYPKESVHAWRPDAIK